MTIPLHSYVLRGQESRTSSEITSLDISVSSLELTCKFFLALRPGKNSFCPLVAERSIERNQCGLRQRSHKQWGEKLAWLMSRVGCKQSATNPLSVTSSLHLRSCLMVNVDPISGSYYWKRVFLEYPGMKLLWDNTWDNHTSLSILKYQ